MSDQNQSACMACSCPCEMHKEHDHPVQKQTKQENSTTCSKCGLKAKAADEMQGHSCAMC